MLLPHRNFTARSTRTVRHRLAQSRLVRLRYVAEPDGLAGSSQGGFMGFVGRNEAGNYRPELGGVHPLSVRLLALRRLRCVKTCARGEPARGGDCLGWFWDWSSRVGLRVRCRRSSPVWVANILMLRSTMSRVTGVCLWALLMPMWWRWVLWRSGWPPESGTVVETRDAEPWR